MTIETPAAVLWDMDGTLVDTEPYWMLAESNLVSSYGGRWTAEDGLALVGQGLEHSAAILQARGVDLPLADIIDQLTGSVLAQTTVELPWRPGALQLLLAIRDAGIRTALVTMSMKPLAEHIANALDRPLFDVMVTGNDVKHPKPHPEPYQLAARQLGLNINSCVVIEDSIPGLASATAAGAVVLGIPAHVELPEGDGYTLWSSLAARTPDDIFDLFRSRRSQIPLSKDLA